MEYVQLVCALIGVLALIFLFFWILRKVNKGILSVSGKRLKVLDRASLGGEKSVVVVSVAGKCMVLGVTAGRIDKIEDLSITEEEYMSELYPEGSGRQDNFFAAFSDAMAKNIKNMRGKKASRDEEPDCGDELPDVRKTDDGTNSDDKNSDERNTESKRQELLVLRLEKCLSTTSGFLSALSCL